MATKSTSTANSKAADRASQISDDFHEMGDVARRIASDSVDAVRDTARDYYQLGQSRARNSYEQSLSRAKSLGETMKSKVQDQPVKSVLIAAGIGFLAACLFRRK